MRNFRLPSRSSWEIGSSALLRSKYPWVVPKRRYVITITRCVIKQKSAVLGTDTGARFENERRIYGREITFLLTIGAY